jgi:hypothetical protein
LLELRKGLRRIAEGFGTFLSIPKVLEMKSKAERLAIFIARLGERPPFANEPEALDGLALILNTVEDEFSGVPSDPTAWESDGRLYPPQEDFARPDSLREGVTEYRSRGHSTFIGSNGAVEIIVRRRGRLMATIYRREGADGKFLRT